MTDSLSDMIKAVAGLLILAVALTFVAIGMVYSAVAADTAVSDYQTGHMSSIYQNLLEVNEQEVSAVSLYQIVHKADRAVTEIEILETPTGTHSFKGYNNTITLIDELLVSAPVARYYVEIEKIPNNEYKLVLREV